MRTGLLFILLCIVVSGATIVRAGDIVYSEAFFQGQSAPAQCRAYGDFSDELVEQTYTSLTLKGSNDEKGRTCTNPDVIAEIALALNTRNGARQTWRCGGSRWTTGACHSQTVQLSASRNTCSCQNPGWVARPCNNRDWGGIDGLTCNAPSQRIEIVFVVGDPEPTACCLPNGSCSMTLPDDCRAEGGITKFRKTCDEVDCKGACCQDDGSCRVISEQRCGDKGGYYKGGVKCREAQCPQLGACCFAGGACDDDVLKRDCDGINWTDSKTCKEIDCPKSIVYSERFVERQPAPDQCKAFDAFSELLLDLDYTTLTLKGSNDETGRTCTDPTVIAEIALALNTRNGARQTWECDGYTWTTGDCNSQTVQLSASGDNCTCQDPGWTCRPCNTQFWGGINDQTCRPASQRIDVVFGLGDPESTACCLPNSSSAMQLPDDCRAMGGIINVGKTCDEVECPPSGACCLPGGACEDDVLERVCIGTNWSEGESCENIDCPTNVVFSEDFTEGQPSPQQCIAWTSFRSQLIKNVNYVRATIKGTFDEEGIAISDPVVVAALAKSMRTGTPGSFLADNGRTWVTGFCGADVTLSASGEVCSCSRTRYLLRPCYYGARWGGVNTKTCEPPSQTMTVEFEVGDVVCQLIKKLKVKCTGGKLKASMRSALATDTVVTIDVNGDKIDITTNRKGNAKLILKKQNGNKTVSIVQCPEFTQEVECG